MPGCELTHSFYKMNDRKIDLWHCFVLTDCWCICTKSGQKSENTDIGCLEYWQKYFAVGRPGFLPTLLCCRLFVWKMSCKSVIMNTDLKSVVCRLPCTTMLRQNLPALPESETATPVTVFLTAIRVTSSVQRRIVKRSSISFAQWSTALKDTETPVPWVN